MGGSAKVVTLSTRADGCQATRSSLRWGAGRILEAGSFFVTAAGQVGPTRGSSTVKLWLPQPAGRAVENSNAEQSVINGTTSVLVSQGVVESKMAGDKLTLIFSATSPNRHRAGCHEGGHGTWPCRA